MDLDSRMRRRFALSLRALDEQLGEEDMEMWRENAPDEHPSQRE